MIPKELQQQDNRFILVYPIVHTHGPVDLIRDFTAAYFLRDVTTTDIIRTITQLDKIADPILQEKINEKVAKLRKLLQHDPVYSKLRPLIEIITTKDGADIPAIVGTHAFQAPSFALTVMLALSAILDRPLSTQANLDQVFRAAVRLDFEDVFISVLKMFRQQCKAKRIATVLEALPVPERLTKVILSRYQTSDVGKVPVEQIVREVDIQFKQAYNALRACVDREYFSNVIGVQTQLSVSTVTIARLTEENRNILVFHLHANIGRAIGAVISILHSLAPGVTAYTAPQIADAIFSKVETDPVIREFFNVLNNTITSQGSAFFDNTSKVCPRITKSVSEIASLKFEKLEQLDKAGSIITSLNKALLSIFKHLFSSADTFTTTVDNFIGHITSTAEQYMQPLYADFHTYITMSPTAPSIINIDTTKLIVDIRHVFQQLVRFDIYAAFLQYICEGLSSVKQEIDISDATSSQWPNYVVSLSPSHLLFIAYALRAKEFDADLYKHAIDNPLQLNLDAAFALVYKNLCSVHMKPFINLMVPDTSKLLYRFINISRHIKASYQQIETFVKFYKEGV